MRRNRRMMTTLRSRRRRERITKRVLLVIAFAVMGLINYSSYKENQELREIIAQNDSVVEEKNSQITRLIYENKQLTEVIDDMDKQLQHVSSVNESYVDELNTLRKRSELYDKYEYAIMDNGKRTELTYEEIEYGESLMVAKGMDSHLMFGSIMVESRANPKAVNAESGATGYGQFLDTTAKWVWTTLLGNDRSTYYSDIRKNGKVNIQMMATYYEHLYSEKKSTFKVVKQYSGNSTDEGTAKYLAKVNKFTRKVGAVVN